VRKEKDGKTPTLPSRPCFITHLSPLDGHDAHAVIDGLELLARGGADAPPSVQAGLVACMHARAHAGRRGEEGEGGGGGGGGE
jgi:hypothetical protein